MPTENKAEPVGTGQEGAGSPAGASTEVPTHIPGGKPVPKLDKLANRAAQKGQKRQHRGDATIFTK